MDGTPSRLYIYITAPSSYTIDQLKCFSDKIKKNLELIQFGRNGDTYQNSIDILKKIRRVESGFRLMHQRNENGAFVEEEKNLDDVITKNHKTVTQYELYTALQTAYNVTQAKIKHMFSC